MTDNYSHLLSLLANGKKSDDGKTAQEIQKELGIGIKRVHMLIREAQSAGMLMSGRRQTMSIDKKRISVPVYSVRRDWSVADHKRDGADVGTERKDDNKAQKKRKSSVHGSKWASSFQS